MKFNNFIRHKVLSLLYKYYILKCISNDESFIILLPQSFNLKL
jgi:hypothetical protein